MVPESAIAVPEFSLRCPERLLAPGPVVRALARLHRNALDRDLADGADPAGSSLLAARAAQLLELPARHRLAGALEGLLEDAQAPGGLLGPAYSRRAVRANRPALRELAGLLRGHDVLYARGVAALRMVLVDGRGPLYGDRHGEALARQLQLVDCLLQG